MLFELHAEARQEFLSPVSRYEAESQGLGARFIEVFERSRALLLDAPHIGAPLGSRLRRYVLPGSFPYSIIYAVRAQTLFVVSVAHGSRRPGFWRNRAIR